MDVSFAINLSLILTFTVISWYTVEIRKEWEFQLIFLIC